MFLPQSVQIKTILPFAAGNSTAMFTAASAGRTFLVTVAGFRPILSQINDHGHISGQNEVVRTVGVESMALTEKQVALVKKSIPAIREQLEPASQAFYQNIFAIDPSMKSLFREDLAGQGMKFLSTLNTIADLLDDPEALDAEISDLAGSHAGLGVNAKHFAPMGAALLVTLGETMGPDFTEELQEAWRSAYDEIASKMMNLSHLS